MKDFGHITTHGNYMMEGKLRDKIFNAINLLVNDVVIPFSKNFIVPYECQQCLNENYEGNSGFRKLLFFKKFILMKKYENSSMDNYLKEIYKKINHL